MKLSLQRVRAAMRTPFVAAHGRVTDRELLIVSLECDDGLVGYGEAAPLPSYDGVSIERVIDALESLRPLLAGYRDAVAIDDILARCSEQTVLAPALAAVDLALWDLAGRRTREPVWRLLGARRAAAVPVNWTISSDDRAGAAREAAEARTAGFATVKVKVGIGDDAGRLAAVRAFAGPRMAIRIDANGAWSVEQAEANLRALSSVDLELCEEPVRGLAATRALRRRTEVPLALDESADDPEALRCPAADHVCLKIARCGGISGTVEAAARARAAGYGVYLASTLDGPLGIAAALHAAAVIAPDRACGLATLGLFTNPPRALAPTAGCLAAPMTAGLAAPNLISEWYGILR